MHMVHACWLQVGCEHCHQQLKLWVVSTQLISYICYAISTATPQ